MVKHIGQAQAICRQMPKNCLNVSDHFVGLAYKVLNSFNPLMSNGNKKVRYFNKSVALICKFV